MKQSMFAEGVGFEGVKNENDDDDDVSVNSAHSVTSDHGSNDESDSDSDDHSTDAFEDVIEDDNSNAESEATTLEGLDNHHKVGLNGSHLYNSSLIFPHLYYPFLYLYRDASKCTLVVCRLLRVI